MKSHHSHRFLQSNREGIHRLPKSKFLHWCSSMKLHRDQRLFVINLFIYFYLDLGEGEEEKERRKVGEKEDRRRQRRKRTKLANRAIVCSGTGARKVVNQICTSASVLAGIWVTFIYLYLRSTKKKK